jgi:S-adenosylmethionine decarboxylase
MGMSFPADAGYVAGAVASPGFEGFEKRLEVEFYSAPIFKDPDGQGIRALSRAQLDSMLREAECTIVAHISNSEMDSYVLSESSLFVCREWMVIKTCGTTQLLRILPLLLEFSEHLCMKVRRVKYTRGTFMFPAVQPYPHGSFADEVSYLEKYFGNLGDGGSAYVMGNTAKFPNWHVYTAADHNTPAADPVYTLEMCMTELNKKSAAQFFKTSGNDTGADMTKRANIGSLLPESRICDFAFDPCGYSMNGIEGGRHSTIHVTPEDGFSYASFESMGYGPEQVDIPTLVENVVAIFRPAVFSMAMHVTGLCKGAMHTGISAAPICPRGYICDGSSRQELPCGSVVVFHTFKAATSCLESTMPIPLIHGGVQQASKKLSTKSIKLKKEKMVSDHI